MQSGPKLGQQTPFGGEIRTKYDQKAAHVLPKWILSLNGAPSPLHPAAQSCRALFWVIWGPFRASWAPSGPAEARFGQSSTTAADRRRRAFRAPNFAFGVTLHGADFYPATCFACFALLPLPLPLPLHLLCLLCVAKKRRPPPGP